MSDDVWGANRRGNVWSLAVRTSMVRQSGRSGQSGDGAIAPPAFLRQRQSSFAKAAGATCGSILQELPLHAVVSREHVAGAALEARGQQNSVCMAAVYMQRPPGPSCGQVVRAFHI